MVAARGRGLGDSFDGQVVRFRRPGGEDDLAGLAPRAVATCSRARSTASLASQPKAMRGARRISILLSEIRQHRLDDAGIKACRRVVIEIDRSGPHAKTAQFLQSRVPRLENGSNQLASNLTISNDDTGGVVASCERRIRSRYVR